MSHIKYFKIFFIAYYIGKYVHLNMFCKKKYFFLLIISIFFPTSGEFLKKLLSYFHNIFHESCRLDNGLNEVSKRFEKLLNSFEI